MIASSVLALLLLMASPPEETCDRLRAGHDALQRGAFSVERHMTILKNGEPVVREVAWLTWRDGTLNTDRVHADVQDRKLDIIDPRVDPAMEQRFACRRVVSIGDDRYVLHAEDGVGRLELRWDAEREIVIPVSWESSEKVRSRFRRIEVETRATYSTFDWRRD